MPKAPYSDPRWHTMSRRFLGRNPLCGACEAQGKVTAATWVDFIRPHKGDMKLFFDTRNWTPLCPTCRNVRSA